MCAFVEWLLHPGGTERTEEAADRGGGHDDAEFDLVKLDGGERVEDEEGEAEALTDLGEKTGACVSVCWGTSQRRVSPTQRLDSAMQMLVVSPTVSGAPIAVTRPEASVGPAAPAVC